MAKSDLVVDINPQAAMICGWTKPEFEIATNQDLDHRGSKDAIDGVSATIKGCGGLPSMTSEKHLSKTNMLECLGEVANIFISIDKENDLISILHPFVEVGK